MVPVCLRVCINVRSGEKAGGDPASREHAAGSAGDAGLLPLKLFSVPVVEVSWLDELWLLE